MKSPSRNPSTYIALLRGINVGGHKIIKMDALREAFVGLGFSEVATYVQSGNVVFKAAAKISGDLAKKIEEMLLRRFNMTVPVIVRNAEEIALVLKNNPFLKENGIDTSRFQVVDVNRRLHQLVVSCSCRNAAASLVPFPTACLPCSSFS
jgi:uncharacterized protein (DUF1697 family)